MRRPSSKQRRLVILLLAVLTFGFAYYVGNQYSGTSPPQISGVLLRPPVPVPEFTLQDQHGNSFSETQLADQWSLILLDPHQVAEPPALLHLVQVHNRLAIEPALQQKIRFIYLPRQTNETINTLAAPMGTGFTTLSGDSEDLTETFSRFGVSDITDGFTLYLIDPDTSIQVLFTGSQDAATIAEDLITLITHHR